MAVALVVQKFGGTSVADPERMRVVAEWVQRCQRSGDQIVLVISAMGKETDELLRMANRVSSVRPGREMDMLITAGERKACALLCMALADIGVKAQSFTGSQAGFLTDPNHENAKILSITPDRLTAALAAGVVPVVAGSQGVSADNDVTFLGRGGSDTTAVALAQALNADLCELYTDVAGIYTADPRVVLNSQKMSTITFDELLEMTATGCPKPAMRSVEVAHNHQVKLHIRSAFSWVPGTLVTEEESDMEQPIIRAVTHDLSESKVTVSDVPDRPGVSAGIFRALAEANVNVDMIVQNVSEEGKTDISFTVPTEDLERAEKVLSSDEVVALGVDRIAADGTIGRVSVIGAGMKSNPGVAATMFETLAESEINIGMISTSAIRVSCVIDADRCEEAVRLLHTVYGLDG